MAARGNISACFALIAKACSELGVHINENDRELPKGRFEQLKEEVAAATDGKTKSPELEEKLSDFESLCKKYLNKLHCVYQTRDLARWEHYTLKMDLCAKVRELNNCNYEDLPKTARELKLIRMRWKDIGSVPHEKSEAIWKEFSSRCDTLQNRITEYYNELEENRRKIAEEKVKICQEAEKMESSEDWEDTAQVFKDLQKRWREIGFTAPEKEKELYMRFRASCDKFFDARKAHYQQSKIKRDNIASTKFRLCEEAKTIFELSYSDAHQLIPDLWRRWKAAGSAGRNDRELYERFRGYFDTYYEGLRRHRSANLKAKKELCGKLEVLEKYLDSGEKAYQDIKDEYLKIKRQWDDTGAMPRAEEKPVLEKYFSLSKKLEGFKAKPKYSDKDILKRSFELEKIVSSALDSLDSKKVKSWEKLRQEWETAQGVEKKYFDKSFKAIGEAFEKDSSEHYEKLLSTSKENLKKRKKICEELENLGIIPEEGATEKDLAEELTQAIAKNFATEADDTKNTEGKTEKINKITERWLNAGAVPLKNLPQLYKKFEQAMTAANS